MIESCFDNHLNVQHATDYMGTYLMYLWAINVIVIIDYIPPKNTFYTYIYIYICMCIYIYNRWVLTEANPKRRYPEDKGTTTTRSSEKSAGTTSAFPSLGGLKNNDANQPQGVPTQTKRLAPSHETRLLSASLLKVNSVE